MPRRRNQSIARPLIAIAIFAFLFITPPGLHLVLSATNWVGRVWAHQIIKSLPTSSP